jgi:hypothetical protein
MFDGLRNDASNTSGFDDQVEFFPEDKPAASARRRKPGQFLGMTAQQRFFVALMLMIAICMLGIMCMVLTKRFVF